MEAVYRKVCAKDKFLFVIIPWCKIMVLRLTALKKGGAIEYTCLYF